MKKFIKIEDKIYNINFIQKVEANGQWLHIHTTNGNTDDIQFLTEMYALHELNRINNLLLD